MNISIVVAISENNAIGLNNQLLWHLPADLKHFKEITTAQTIVMGRKTYNSIGKPLPNRRNIVITRQTDFQVPGIEVAHSVEDALSLAEHESEVFIIGGSEVYRHTLSAANTIYLTTVHANFEADAFFPIIDPATWQETERKFHPKDEKNAFDFTFSKLIRK